MDSVAEKTETRVDIDLDKELATLPIGDKNMANLALVYSGLKPATEFDLVYLTETEEEYPFERFGKDAHAVQVLLDRLSLPFKINNGRSWKSDVSDEGFSKDYWIGHDKKKLQALVDAIRTSSPDHYHRSMGLALGYPQTAVDAFMQKPSSIIKNEDLPSEVRSSDAFKFKNFGLSQDHWREEFEYIQECADTVKQTTPELYQRFVNSYRII